MKCRWAKTHRFKIAARKRLREKMLELQRLRHATESEEAFVEWAKGEGCKGESLRIDTCREMMKSALETKLKFIEIETDLLKQVVGGSLDTNRRVHDKLVSSAAKARDAIERLEQEAYQREKEARDIRYARSLAGEEFEIPDPDDDDGW